mmetsp:Transcript_98690/g.265158  ORF Transcript_98690/g.265158 Transcript_98690/m.265158 type:complete len:95 (-) Transcript_98690:32-316(-)
MIEFPVQLCTKVAAQPTRKLLRTALCNAIHLCKCEIVPNDSSLHKMIENKTNGVPTLQEVSTTNKNETYAVCIAVKTPMNYIGTHGQGQPWMTW